MAHTHNLHRETVLVDSEPNALQWLGITLQRVVYFVLDVLLVVLATRFILRLFGANPANDFVELVYSLTTPLVVPFSGIFGSVSSAAVSAFEISTLISMIVYTLIAYAIARLVGIMTVTRA
ncbi:MAG: YggT family protein [Candidatus Andersenbacteria bacterium]